MASLSAALYKNAHLLCTIPFHCNKAACTIIFLPSHLRQTAFVSGYLIPDIAMTFTLHFKNIPNSLSKPNPSNITYTIFSQKLGAMKTLLTTLLLLPGAFSLQTSSPTNSTSTAPCVSHDPQTTVDADLVITIWNQTNCQGSADTSYPFVYNQNSWYGTFFKSYTLSRTYCLQLFFSQLTLLLFS